jgi:hypothetical protein
MFKFHHPHLMALPPILPPGYIILKQNNWECPITSKLIIYALCSTHQTQAPISSLSQPSWRASSACYPQRLFEYQLLKERHPLHHLDHLRFLAYQFPFHILFHRLPQNELTSNQSCLLKIKSFIINHILLNTS